MRRRLLFLGLLVFCFWAKRALAVDYITSTSCTTAGASACNVNGCFVCNGTTWTQQPLIVGGASTCDSSHAGLLRWTGTSFQGCDGTTWAVLSTGACAGPSAFSFTNQTGVAVSTAITSDTKTLSGFACTAGAVCTNCTILKNGIAQGTTANFNNGDTIAIRTTSSANYGTAVTASVSVGQTSSGTWSVTTTSDTCSGTPTPGTVCPDGTIYAGQTPDGNVNMYVTPCDAGMTGTQGACTGTRATKKWSNAGTIATGVTNFSTGKANTATLYADNANADAPYEAAVYCYTLNAYGHTDWYLPAIGELSVLYANNAAIGGFDTSGTWYWSSTELNYGNAYYQKFSDGTQGQVGKGGSNAVRCARR